MAVVRGALQEQVLAAAAPAADQRAAMGLDSAGAEALVAAVHEDVHRYFADDVSYVGEAAVKSVGDVLRQMLQ